MSQSTRINVALIGYGYAGKTFHLPLIKATKGLELITVGSSNANKVHADWPEVEVLSNPDDIFAKPDIELVVIATPNLTHFDLARRALLAGKHVVVDKPFTITVAEAQTLQALAESRGLLLSVFHNRRWDGDFLTLRHLIEQKRLGEIKHYEAHFDRYRPQVRQRWRENDKPGAGLWYDLGAHLIDQTLHLFGMPQAIYADLQLERAGALAVDYFHVLLRYPSTKVILHASCLVAGGSPHFIVHGSNGSYVKHGLDTQEAALLKNVKPGSENWGHDPIDGIAYISEGNLVKETAVPTLAGNYLEYYTGIHHAIGEQGKNPVSAQDAIAVMRIIEAGCHSAQLRQELPIELPLS